MENMRQVLATLVGMNQTYGLSTEQIEHLLEEMPEAKVCTPVIGKFSSGKSALVNTLLGYNYAMLKEDITPETAVPTEIVYTEGEEGVRIYRNGEEFDDVGVDEYREMVPDASQITHVRLALNNSLLRRIPDVMLVDMPGFDSGFEIHNKAIDNYLPQSLAYIVAFPADDMIVRSSVGNILKELVLNNMPICIVITKYDKRNDEFEQSLEKLKESLKRFIGDWEVRICLSSSRDEVIKADEVEEFLFEIQEQSQEILVRKYRGRVLSALENMESYLLAAKKGSEMSESELDQEEERLEKQMANLNYKFAGEKENFEIQIVESIEEIKNDVQTALEAEESTLVTMALNNQSINEQINTVVRNTVTTSVNKRFVPKIEKYLKRVEQCINGENIGNVHVSFHFDAQQIGTGLTTSIVALVAGLVLGLPILGTIIAEVAYLFGKASADRKREEQRASIRGKLQNEVYPQVMNEVGSGVEKAITKQIGLINTAIDEELAQQKETLTKAITDVRERISDEIEKKESLFARIQGDLAKIKELRESVIDA